MLFSSELFLTSFSGRHSELLRGPIVSHVEQPDQKLRRPVQKFCRTVQKFRPPGNFLYSRDYLGLSLLCFSRLEIMKIVLFNRKILILISSLRVARVLKLRRKRLSWSTCWVSQLKFQSQNQTTASVKWSTGTSN